MRKLRRQTSELASPLTRRINDLLYMLEKTTPLGLILFDGTFNFKEVLKAKKGQIYSHENRKAVEFYFGKGVEEIERELMKTDFDRKLPDI